MLQSWVSYLLDDLNDAVAGYFQLRKLSHKEEKDGPGHTSTAGVHSGSA
jgi:hypothetical protein